MINGLSPLMACGWSEDWEGASYRFFEPDYASVEEYKPFHFTFDRLYDYELLDEGTSESANLSAWSTYLGAAYPENDVRKLVYECDLDLLNQLKQDITDRRAVPSELSNNALVKDWKANKRLELLDYLILAHRAQPFCLYEYDEWSEIERHNDGIQPVIDDAKRACKNAPDQFLKLRYAYQAMRLEQYSDQHERAIETYQQLALPNAGADKLIASWAQCHFAGCLRAKELEAEAAYNFSKVFDQCPSRRIQAWYGWRILSDEVWHTVQAKCQNNHEMAVILFLNAFSDDAIAQEDMRQIHELDPGSKMLDVLLMREINKLENNFLGNSYSESLPVYKRLSKEAVAELADFVQTVIQSGKMNDRNIWELASIYLRFLGGDAKSASEFLAARQPTLTGDGALKGKLMDLVFRIGSAEKVDRSLENSIFKDFTNLSAKLKEEEVDELARFRDDALGWLYQEQEENAKAMLARNHGYRLMNYPIDLEMVNEMIAFEAKEDKTLYEKELLKRLPSEDGRNFLIELKGTGLLGRNLLPEAIRVFQQLPESYRNSGTFRLEADPFASVITDVVNCDDCDAGKYNKLSFAEAVLDLQKKVVSDPSKAAEYNILLGNAYYSTTYFGAAWATKDYYRSGGSWYSLGMKDGDKPFDVDRFDEVVDIGPAKEYYSKAIAAAKDKEMAALAAFLYAKCELIDWYCIGAEESQSNYQKGFAMLKNSYRKTDVYKDLIKECRYFQDYARN